MKLHIKNDSSSMNCLSIRLGGRLFRKEGDGRAEIWDMGRGRAEIGMWDMGYGTWNIGRGNIGRHKDMYIRHYRSREPARPDPRYT